ncbi:unnamed protein product [Rhodiola kirilowii]
MSPSIATWVTELQWKPHGSLAPRSGSFTNGFATTLLDEFKSNKNICCTLSEIAGHVVEFSTDQYGSRFIQQKFETATVEEKSMIFHEIMPQAFTLMTDVFGNYVVQKGHSEGNRSCRSGPED